jgi:hypothetical protein
MTTHHSQMRTIINFSSQFLKAVAYISVFALVNTVLCCFFTNKKSEKKFTNSGKKATADSFTSPNKADIFNTDRDTLIHKNNTIHFNLSKLYSSRTIAIQDFADIEYIALKRTDNNIFEGTIASFSQDKIIGYNRKGGNIFEFDRTGKIKLIINKQGKGPGEYLRINGLIYDKKSNEIFVNDMLQKRILVYNYNGKHKRSFYYLDKTFYAEIENFGNNILCYDERTDHTRTFFLISKLDGTIIDDIHIPYHKKSSLTLFFPVKENQMLGVEHPYKKAVIYNDKYILNEISSDTIFYLTFDKKLEPFVARNPSLAGQDPAKYLIIQAQTKQYIFFKIVNSQFDISSKKGFSTKNFCYHKKEAKIYEANIINSDYSTNDEFKIESPVSPGVLVKQIDAYQLINAYQKGELKGKLKEIASTLNENDNPVLMIIKLKNTL